MGRILVINVWCTIFYFSKVMVSNFWKYFCHFRTIRNSSFNVSKILFRTLREIWNMFHGWTLNFKACVAWAGNLKFDTSALVTVTFITMLTLNAWGGNCGWEKWEGTSLTSYISLLQIDPLYLAKKKYIYKL